MLDLACCLDSTNTTLLVEIVQIKQRSGFRSALCGLQQVELFLPELSVASGRSSWAERRKSCGAQKLACEPDDAESSGSWLHAALWGLGLGSF